jgi:hypothetical protein
VSSRSARSKKTSVIEAWNRDDDARSVTTNGTLRYDRKEEQQLNASAFFTPFRAQTRAKTTFTASRRRFEPAVTRNDDAKETHPRERSVDFKTAGGVDEEESGYFRRAVTVYARQRDEESVFTFD